MELEDYKGIIQNEGEGKEEIMGMVLEKEEEINKIVMGVR